MTVTIGRRELLAALGGAAAAWPRSSLAFVLPALFNAGSVVTLPCSASAPDSMFVPDLRLIFSALDLCL